MAAKSSDKGILLEAGTNEVEFLRFGILGQIFGINVAKVRQVMVYYPDQVVQIPGTPHEITGQFCFRGNPIPVIDLTMYLKKQIPDSDRRLLLVCEFNLTTVGFVVDSVDRILRCSWGSFKPLEQSQFGSANVSIVGTVMTADEMIPVVDVELVLAELIPSAGMESKELSEKQKHSTLIDRKDVSLVYCEDSSIVQRVLLKTLQSAGFEKIRMFPNGADAMEHLRAHPREPIDIFISDIEMPKMDGLTFCRELRGLASYQKTPFVFFSSTVSEEMKRKCKLVGGDRAYSKPEIDGIVGAIDELIVARRT